MTQHLDIQTGLAAPGGELLSTEWLLTNGLGSYAASTVVGCNSRKYHGLLVAAGHSPGERAVLLSAAVEEFVISPPGGEAACFPLSCFQFAGAFHPRGDMLLAEFSRQADGVVRFTYRLPNGLAITRSVVLARQANAVAIRYELSGPGGKAAPAVGGVMRVRPLLAYRHYHANRRCGDGTPAVVADAIGNVLNLMDVTGRWPTLHVHLPGPFRPEPQWWYDFRYAFEAERGEDPTEDLFSPGVLELPLTSAKAAEFRAAADPFTPVGFDESAAGRAEHARSLLSAAGKTSGKTSELVLAADDFIVQRTQPGSTRRVATILAGFPWFADWGRDAFVAMEGLLLTTGRAELAFGVLLRFAGAIHNGLAPNRFSDEVSGPAGMRSRPCDYNSADASLWFVRAAFAWARVTGDWAAFDSKLLGAVKVILDAYCAGTDYNIHVDPEDGLLVCGNQRTQVTWMDAMVDGRPITPRAGKPVEVNALFGHALGLLADRLAARGEADQAAAWRQRHERWRANFVHKFPSPRRGLYDLIDLDGQPDDRIRPNQLLAVSLAPSPLPIELQREVVEVAVESLLTPVGLRSLAPGEPGYRGRYAGDRLQRDEAYHQGTVWAWLIGPFIEAYLRVNDFSDGAKRQAIRWIEPLLNHMSEAGLGQISEIFDGDPPHTPRGCFAQAWSVAEVLRVLRMVE